MRSQTIIDLSEEFIGEDPAESYPQATPEQIASGDFIDLSDLPVEQEPQEKPQQARQCEEAIDVSIGPACVEKARPTLPGRRKPRRCVC